MADDLLERMRRNPRDWRIDDVARVCSDAGVLCTPPRSGSHYIALQGKGSSRRFVFDRAGSPADQARLHPRIDPFHRRCSGDESVNPQDYEVDIRPLSADDGGGFIATVPELPGCFSDGGTPEKALHNAYDAIGCWIEAAEEMNRPVPEPRRAAA